MVHKLVSSSWEGGKCVCEPNVYVWSSALGGVVSPLDVSQKSPERCVVVGPWSAGWAERARATVGSPVYRSEPEPGLDGSINRRHVPPNVDRGTAAPRHATPRHALALTTLRLLKIDNISGATQQLTILLTILTLYLHTNHILKHENNYTKLMIHFS